MLAEAVSYYKKLGKTLVDVLNDLYEEFGYYVETQTSLTLYGEEGSIRLKEILSGLRENRLTEINGVKVIKWEDYGTLEYSDNDEIKPLEGFTQSEVLKYFLEDGAWIAVRPSGTEPKCKTYFCVMGSSMEDAQNKADGYIAAMNKIVA